MSMEETRQKAIEKAESEGLKVISANDNCLQLDIDSQADLDFAMEMLKLLAEEVYVTEIGQTRSKSGNWHIYVMLGHPLTVVERILLQACLGSDRKREFLNFIYQKFDDGTGDCLLFEMKDAKPEPVKL